MKKKNTDPQTHFLLAMSCLWLSALSSCVRSHSMRSRIMPKTGRHSSYTGNLYRLHLVMLTIIINTVFRCRIFKSRCKVLANIFLPKSGSWTIREIFFFDSTDESVGKDAANANYKTLKGFNTSDFGNRYYMTGNFYGSFSRKKPYGIFSDHQQLPDSQLCHDP